MKAVDYNLNEILLVAGEFWNEYKQHKIWAFHAEMGSGKTTFIHALCDVLQVKNAVGSPTFAIINEYTSAVAGTIFHMDWYRIKSKEEAMEAGCEDCIESGAWCFIEWPEKFPGLLPEDSLHISLEVINNSVRKISIM